MKTAGAPVATDVFSGCRMISGGLTVRVKVHLIKNNCMHGTIKNKSVLDVSFMWKAVERAVLSTMLI